MASWTGPTDTCEIFAPLIFAHIAAGARHHFRGRALAASLRLFQHFKIGTCSLTIVNEKFRHQPYLNILRRAQRALVGEIEVVEVADGGQFFPRNIRPNS